MILIYFVSFPLPRHYPIIYANMEQKLEMAASQTTNRSRTSVSGPPSNHPS